MIPLQWMKLCSQLAVPVICPPCWPTDLHWWSIVTATSSIEGVHKHPWGDNKISCNTHAQYSMPWTIQGIIREVLGKRRCDAKEGESRASKWTLYFHLSGQRSPRPRRRSLDMAGGSQHGTEIRPTPSVYLHVLQTRPSCRNIPTETGIRGVTTCDDLIIILPGWLVNFAQCRVNAVPRAHTFEQDCLMICFPHPGIQLNRSLNSHDSWQATSGTGTYGHGLTRF